MVNGADEAARPVVRLEGVGWRRDRRWIVREIDWAVLPGQRWVILGTNGSGKSTLLRIAGLQLHPSAGVVEVFGERLGRADVRSLRARIGTVSAALAADLRPQLETRDVVMTARFGALEPWWHAYDDDDRQRAEACLARLGVDAFADRPWGSLSSGERQRVLLARSLMNDPGLLILDEPAAGLDLPGREALLGSLGALADDPATPPVLLVTHHVEEIPAGMTHALLLRDGRVLASGPIDETLDADHLGAAMGIALALEYRDGRFSARRV